LVGNLQLAIRQLSDEDQLLVMLFYFDGQTIEDMAKITALGVSNIKVKLHRIRKKLKEILTINEPENAGVF
jgi:RNA polymerase sigma factor (sigma-70 family)